MVLKRKGVSTTVKASKLSKMAKDAVEETEEGADEQIVAVEKVMKKPAGAQAKKQADVVEEEEENDDDEEEEEDEEEDGDEEEEEKEEISPEKALAKKEEEIKVERTKELKSMYMADLKELVTENGLATGAKEAMIKALLKHEAKARAETRAQESKIRGVVVKKKEELEGKSMAELAKLCECIGSKGAKGKPDRVAALLMHWQKNDGVEKALTQMALDERREELATMDNESLRKMCDKAGIDPFLKEVMVDRISKKEHEMGRYMKAVPAKEPVKALQNVDMVDALLANEQNRKKEKQMEDAVANKKKELKSMGVDELKKALTAKGLDASGKKDDMVEALFAAKLQDEALAARKSELKKMALPELKTLLSNQGLDTAAGKDKMIQAILAHEKNREEELLMFDKKVEEVVEQRKQELQRKSNAELKSLCQKNGLAVGGGKEERVERLVDEVRNDGSIEKDVSKIIRGTKKEEFMRMEKDELLSLCEKMEVDPFVKDVMIERILCFESENGEPVSKKQRKK